MRLDKFLSECGKASRKESANNAKQGKITVNGVPCLKADTHIHPETDEICYCGETIIYRKFTYLMCNKPAGIVSATDDPKEKTVIDLLPPELQHIGLFPCGRLDKNTLGLVLLTNDGVLSHQLLAPKRHVCKDYAFSVKFPLSMQDIEALCNGVEIGERTPTKPCEMIMDEEKSGVITLTEGKYHQIKRMMEAVHNQITHLERIRFAGIALDPNLQRGSWRYLTTEEIALLQSHINS